VAREAKSIGRHPAGLSDDAEADHATWCQREYCNGFQKYRKHTTNNNEILLLMMMTKRL